MRNLAAIGLAFIALLNPTGSVQSLSAQPVTHTTPYQTASGITLDTNNPYALTVKLHQPDYTTDVILPARAKAAAQLAAKLATAREQATHNLQTAGLKANFAALYVQAAATTGTPWQILAAVHQTETGQSGSTLVTSYAGALGPMQFMPGTFAAYQRDGDGDGIANIGNVADAVATAGHYLAAGGAANGNYTAALLNYNHSSAYVNHVLSIARSLGL